MHIRKTYGKKSSDSIIVNIPKKLAQELNIVKGTYIDCKIEDNKLIMTKMGVDDDI